MTLRWALQVSRSVTGKHQGTTGRERWRVAQTIDKQHGFTAVLVKQRGQCDSIPPTQPPWNHLICCDKNRLESPTCSQTTHCLHSINLWKLCLCLHISHMLTHRTSLELLPLQTHLHIQHTPLRAVGSYSKVETIDDNILLYTH